MPFNRPFRHALAICALGLAGLGAGMALDPGRGAVRAETALFYASGQGQALGGYDVVSYFRADAPQPGRSEFAVSWRGAIWLFSSRANQAAFESDPRAFAPQFGGYCAYAVSQGYTASGDFQSWRIVDGRLYIVHGPAVARLWARDIPGHIALAVGNWPGVLER